MSSPLERLCCGWCGQDQHLSRCSRCHNAFYCCREHQRAHWPLHRPECVEMENTASHINVPKNSSPWNLNSKRLCSQPVFTPSVDDLETIQQFNALAGNSLIDFQLFDNSQKTDGYDTPQHLRQEGTTFESVDDSLFLEQTKCTSYADSSITSETLPKSTKELDQICKNLIKDMNSYGICVIDNFLGRKCGDAILQEVRDLYQSGHFREGQLVSNRGASKAIRGDWITWVNGTEDRCKTIGELIKKLDAIITKCNKMEHNGILKNYKITTRTKAMIACYPGSGTRYVKHVDNPNNDGRCITCIYYLNKDWDTKLHGGLLQMFPTGLNSQVANIEPFFDRIIFFWSDRRNPHEVQPSFKIRFAITVWYFDFEERKRALRKYHSADKAIQSSAFKAM